MTGVYDSALHLTYWTTGNPSPDYNGDDRLGDNLYASSVVALDARRGQLKWHFQFTPHNVWDWDAQQPHRAHRHHLGGSAAQAAHPGEPQRVLLRARPYRRRAPAGEAVRQQLTWASELGPTAGPSSTRTSAEQRRHAHLSVVTRRRQLVLDIVQSGDRALLRTDARELQRLRQAVSEWAAGRSLWGGTTRQAPDAPNQKILRAIDVTTARSRGSFRSRGPAPHGAARWGRRRRAVHLRRPGPFRRPRRGIRQIPLALRYEQRVASVSDGVSLRRQAARGHRLGIEHYFVRACGVDQMQQEIRRPGGH